jgi:hypothetical protein
MLYHIIHTIASSLNKVIKSKRMRWVGHGRAEVHAKFWSQNLKVRDHMGGGKILEWVIEKQ